MTERPGTPGGATPGATTEGRSASWIPLPPEAVPGPGPALPPEARKTRGTVGWDILLGFDLSAIGLTALLGVVAYLYFVASGEPVVSPEQSGAELLWATNVWNLITYGVVPFVWVLGTRVGGWSGALHYLGLTRPFPSIFQGFGYAALLVSVVLFGTMALEALGFGFESTGAEARFAKITWGYAVVTSLIAGFAEEVFFRGVLQKWIGVWGQAVVFGLLHLPAGWMAFFITGSIGLLFGFLVKRGRSLWLVIAAHAAYNMTLFTVAFLLGS